VKSWGLKEITFRWVVHLNIQRMDSILNYYEKKSNIRF
jgi:hypothetical protein